jgi:hypothetical protein
MSKLPLLAADVVDDVLFDLAYQDYGPDTKPSDRDPILRESASGAPDPVHVVAPDAKRGISR